MTELDFDELDKAVNSLMAESDTAEKLPQTAATPDVAQPSSTTPSTPTASSPALKRGRFMDIVAPGSTVRTAPVAVKREAAEVTPPTVDEAITSDVPPIDMPEAVPEPSPSIVDDVSIEPTSAEDMAEGAAPSSELDMTSEHLETPPMDSSAEQAVADQPLTSPFLADAKVEKRPLGGDNTTTVELEASEASANELSVDGDTSEPKEIDEEKPVLGDGGTVEPIPLPDELHEDVVAIESSEVMHDDAPVADSEPTMEPQPATAEPTTVEQQTPVGGSITQQYDEQPSSGDQTNGAIYDTSTYHQPLETAASKKKSSVLTWILWTLVLLILGATAGAAWFYFTTQ